MSAITEIVRLYDKIAVKIHGYKKVPDSPVGFFYLVPTSYTGETIVLKDNTTVKKGEMVLELHIINTNLSNLNTSYGNLFRMLREELYYVAKYLNQKENQQYKAVFGITLLHRLAKRAGFTVIDIGNPFKRKMFSLGENILRKSLGKESNTKKKTNKTLEAKECWMSRDEIIGFFNS